MNESIPNTPATGLLLQSLETPTLTKAELAELLFDRLGLNKRESKDMVEAFFEIVHGSLVQGQDVKLSGFGNFNVRRKAPRPGRNPRTGESIPIKARQVVTFKPLDDSPPAQVPPSPGAGRGRLGWRRCAGAPLPRGLCAACSRPAC